ncbi:unnamed protein product [Polarella glacialis]|uniref:C2H2-type domain-containing protein n=1 Tax=Polarella glacialis TaxID=89957 RepID=A0A813GXD8_POLGL|nr:unnamed protein product [Polarella glacialis]
MTQDPDRLAALFAPEAVYVERAFDPASTFRGRDAIRDYWASQIVGKQANISFRHVVGDMVLDVERRRATVKWLAEFDNIRFCSSQAEKRVRFVQVAILEFTQDTRHILHLEEYLQSTSDSRFRWPALDTSELRLRSMLSMEPNAFGTQQGACSCEFCGREFPSRNALFRHFRSGIPFLDSGTSDSGGIALGCPAQSEDLSKLQLPPSELVRESRRHVALTISYHCQCEVARDGHEEYDLSATICGAALAAFPSSDPQLDVVFRPRVAFAVPVSVVRQAAVNVVTMRLPRCAEGDDDVEVACKLNSALEAAGSNAQVLWCTSVGLALNATRICELQRYEALLPWKVFVAAELGALGAGGSRPGLSERALAQRLKRGIRYLRGAECWQNFCERGKARGELPRFQLNRVTATWLPEHPGWCLVSLAVRRALPGMVQRILGGLVAWARGAVPEDFLEQALSPSEDFLGKVPKAPESCLNLRAPHMFRYENKTGLSLTQGAAAEISLQQLRAKIISVEDSTRELESWADGLPQ